MDAVLFMLFQASLLSLAIFCPDLMDQNASVFRNLGEAAQTRCDIGDLRGRQQLDLLRCLMNSYV